jgi:hypothetical protein
MNQTNLFVDPATFCGPCFRRGRMGVIADHVVRGEGFCRGCFIGGDGLKLPRTRKPRLAPDFKMRAAGDQ